MELDPEARAELNEALKRNHGFTVEVCPKCHLQLLETMYDEQGEITTQKCWGCDMPPLKFELMQVDRNTWYASVENRVWQPEHPRAALDEDQLSRCPIDGKETNQIGYDYDEENAILECLDGHRFKYGGDFRGSVGDIGFTRITKAYKKWTPNKEVA